MSVSKILVAVDGSDAGLRAMAKAVELGAALGAELDVISVLDLGQLEFYDGFYMNDEQLEAWQTRLKKETLDAAMERVPRTGPKTSARMVRGRVADAILGELKAGGHEMLVVGRTGKGAIDRLVVGSVSRKLASKSPVPVLIVG